MKDNKKRKRSVSEKSYASRAPLSDLEPPQIYRGNSQRGRALSKEPTRNQTRRRQNKKRRLKNSVRRALLAFCLLVVLIAFGVTLSLTVFFKTEIITAQGSGIYAEQQIIDASGINSENNLFLIDKDEISNRITRQLPYIGKVTVERKLPNTVNIEVSDTFASYAVENPDGSYILMDADFKVLDNASAQNPADTVMISKADISKSDPGSEIVFSDKAVQDRIAEIAKAVNEAEMTQATEIYTEGVNSNYIVYMDRITFELGSLDNLDDKIVRGLASCEKLDENGSNMRGNLNLTVDKQSYFTPE